MTQVNQSITFIILLFLFNLSSFSLNIQTDNNYRPTNTDSFNIITYFKNHFPTTKEDKAYNVYLYKKSFSEEINNGFGLIERKITKYYYNNNVFFFEILKDSNEDTIGYNILGSWLLDKYDSEISSGKTTIEPHFISKNGKYIIKKHFLFKGIHEKESIYIFFEPTFLDTNFHRHYHVYGRFAYKPSKYKFYKEINDSLYQIFEFDNNRRGEDSEVYDFELIRVDEKVFKSENNITDFYFTFICPKIYKNNKGLINEKGNVLFEAQFKDIYLIDHKKNDIFLVEKFNTDPNIRNEYVYGLIKSDGQFLFRPVFEEINLSKNESNLGIVKYKGKYGFLDKNYSIHIEAKYFDYKILNRQYALVQKGKNDFFGYEDFYNKYWTYLNLLTKSESEIQIQDFAKEDIGTYEIFPVKISNKWGFANKYGKIIIPPKFYSAMNFHDGVSFVSFRVQAPNIKRNIFSYQLIDINGNVVTTIPTVIGNDIYEVGYFSDGLMKYKSRSNGKFGYLNKKGQIQIPPQFEECSSFLNGKAFATKYGSQFLINTKGDRID